MPPLDSGFRRNDGENRQIGILTDRGAGRSAVGPRSAVILARHALDPIEGRGPSKRRHGLDNFRWCLLDARRRGHDTECVDSFQLADALMRMGIESMPRQLTEGR
jgi:hypothetical protein